VTEWKNQKGYPNPQWGPFREIWHLTREAGESALILLMVDSPKLTTEQQSSLQNLIRNFDYPHNASCGLVYHLAAYWKARRHHFALQAPDSEIHFSTTLTPLME
jgi:hypothetical protein